MLQLFCKECNIIFPKTTATSINIKTDIEMPNYYVYDIYGIYLGTIEIKETIFLNCFFYFLYYFFFI